MKKVITLTHGDLGKGFLSAYKVIACEENAFTAISMYEQDSPETVQEKINTELQKTSPEDIIIFMTDIAAGSTTKGIIPFLESYENLYIVTGLNLPLLLEILMTPIDENPAEIIRNAVKQSQESVQFINDLMQ